MVGRSSLEAEAWRQIVPIARYPKLLSLQRDIELILSSR
jgi:hypothetical protein